MQEEIRQAAELDGGEAPPHDTLITRDDWSQAVKEADIKKAEEEMAGFDKVGKHRGGHTYHRDKKKYRAANRMKKAGRKANRKR